MTELELAASVWKHAVENAALDDHPAFWLAHFADTDHLGSAYTHDVKDEPSLVLILGSPFAVCDEVTDTFAFLDRPGHVLISHISYEGTGVRTSDYKLEYTFGDRGIIDFGDIAKQWHPSERVRNACDDLADRRLRAPRTYPFDDSFLVAIKWGEIHESS